MRKLILASTLGALALLAPVAGTLRAQTPTVAQVAHSRVLPLQGGQNFRDLGGYRTRDGHTVKWGVLYRSGAMNSLTEADFLYLAKLGIRTVCDFRSVEERQAAPVRWPAGQAPKVLADDYRMDAMGGFDFKAANGWTGEQARAVMTAQYPRTLERFNSQYRRMFDQLLAGDMPLAFNCSAGKDRTGVAAALILTALNVPRETVIEDYLLSNRYFDPKKSLAKDDAASQAWRQMPQPVLQAFMGVDRGYIEAAFKVIDAHAGGAEGYLRDELGLDRTKLETLRRLYTTQ
uniref:tyrosine-protein phosphatase n=1 Tax=uncultured Caulobacter sp. TaxID=158749 RepID=UPI0025E051E0|nr:tyrosine-protein phosphatase [uncultured Caulobacter sp.]